MSLYKLNYYRHKKIHNFLNIKNVQNKKKVGNDRKKG